MTTRTEKTLEAAGLAVIALLLARSLIGMAEDLATPPKPDPVPRDAYGFRVDGPAIGEAERRPSAEPSAATCSGSPRGC